MIKNVGKADKYFRIILGIIIVILGFIFKSWLGAIGLIPILTGVINWCPLYLLLGISTSKEDKYSNN